MSKITITVKGGTPRDLNELAPATRERILRGIRKYANETIDPLSATLAERILAAAKGGDS
jgi:hypothetical protein